MARSGSGSAFDKRENSVGKIRTSHFPYSQRMPYFLRRCCALLFSALALATFIFTTSAHAAPSLQAQVDRNSVEVGDSFTLTVRLDDSSDSPPDFRVLAKNFSILSENSSSGLSASIGRIERWTEWQVTLSPLRAGQLTIPALELNGARSEPITIRATPANTRAAGGEEPIFLEVKLDHDSVYVQQQLLFSVRIYQAIPLNEMNITEPEFDNATVRKISQDKFLRTVNGVSYQVHELVYAIFPQQPGELTIPELVFSGSEAQRSRSIFDFPRPGRPVRKLTQQLTAQVKPIPKQFSGKTWLPARNLTLQETWGGNPQNISVGNSITRSIAIQADGVMASQLPALSQPQLDNAKLYGDQPALDDQADASGMHGNRVESSALIPTAAGELRLPEVQVHWWDLDSDSEKVATIAAQTLQVAGATNAQSATAPATAPDVASPITNQDTPTAINTAQVFTTVDRADHWLWQVAAALFALAWLTTLWLYWRLKNTLRGATSNSAPNGDTFNAAQTTHDQQSLEKVITACRSNDAPMAHRALTQWVRTAHPRSPTLAQWSEVLQFEQESSALRDAILQLDRHCFQHGNPGVETQWNGSRLAEELKKLQKQRGRRSAADHQLPPLYPTGH